MAKRFRVGIRTWFARIVRAIPIAGLVLLAVPAVAPEASAASAAHPVSSVLSAVSCVTPRASTCFAVGHFSRFLAPDAVPVKTLIERWDGKKWSIVPSPNPDGAKNTELSSVSCTSATNCTAVGYSAAVSNHIDALVEHWDGKAWSIVPSPTESPASGLLGVSCTSATFCVAVGNEFLRWDGRVWSAVPSPSSPGFAVSCTSESNCVAVGDAPPVRWDGKAWSIVTRAKPGDGAMRGMAGVSCTSATRLHCRGH